MNGATEPSVLDFRAAVARGEQLVGRIGREVRALVVRSRADLASDVRRLQRDLGARADAAMREIDARRTRVLGLLEQRIATASEALLRRLSAATQTELAALNRRVAMLEKQLGLPTPPRPSARKRRR